jgi:hypothetical protein
MPLLTFLFQPEFVPCREGPSDAGAPATGTRLPRPRPGSPSPERAAATDSPRSQRVHARGFSGAGKKVAQKRPEESNDFGSPLAMARPPASERESHFGSGGDAGRPSRQGRGGRPGLPCAPEPGGRRSRAGFVGSGLCSGFAGPPLKSRGGVPGRTPAEIAMSDGILVPG